MIGKNGDSAAGEKGPGRFAQRLSPRLPPRRRAGLSAPLLPRWPATSYAGRRRRRESVQVAEPVSGGRFQAHRAEGRALRAKASLGAGGNRIKRRFSNSAPGLCQARLEGAEASLPGQGEEGKVPGGSQIWGPRRSGGGEQLYQAKHVYFPCLHVGKIQAPYGFSGGRRWLLASPQGLAGVSHPKNPTLPSTAR